MNRRLTALLAGLVVTATAFPVKAQVMTSVERRNPNAASAAAFVRLAPGPLGEGAVIYADRTHLYRNVPPALVGAQYIIMAMEDKDNPYLELHIKIGQPGTLYLILDNRVGTNLRSPTATPNPFMAGMAWAPVMGFADTGLDMAVDELADGTIDNYYSIFSIPVTPGEVILRAQNDRLNPRDRNMYGVAATGDVWSFTTASVTAFDPVPADGTGWVAPGIALSWTAGKDAVLHDLYLGTDQAAVDSGAPSTFQGTVSITTWMPAALEPGTTYFWRIDEIAADGTKNAGPVWSFTTIAVIEIGAPSLLAWWRMDEGSGTKVVDWSGHGRHAALGTPAPTWAQGIGGGALRFAGNGDHAVYLDGSFLNGLDALTITAWIKSNVTYTDKGFLIFEAPNGNDNVDLRYDADGFVAGGRNLIKAGITISEYGVDTVLQLESSNEVQTTDWQHVALVWGSGQALALYLNGQLDIPAAGSMPATGTLSAFSTATIGKGGKDISNSSWEGLIDDLRIYRRALTPEEIQATGQDDPLLAHDPSPADDASIDGFDFLTLTWQAGDQAIAHDVYVGAEQATVDAATPADTTGVYRGRQSGASYTPTPPLPWGPKYFWRVDEVNLDGSISRGRIWHFVLGD